jgi:hypothetical protein
VFSGACHVVEERSKSLCGVEGAGGVVIKHVSTGGRIIVAVLVVMECAITGGRIGEPSTVVIERVKTEGRIV